jgi:hypothetical protein
MQQLPTVRSSIMVIFRRTGYLDVFIGDRRDICAQSTALFTTIETAAEPLKRVSMLLTTSSASDRVAEEQPILLDPFTSACKLHSNVTIWTYCLTVIGYLDRNLTAITLSLHLDKVYLGWLTKFD